MIQYRNKVDTKDYISLTDMAKAKTDSSRAADVIKNWLRSRTILEFLGAWEMLYNPNFKVAEFDHFRKEAGLHTFTLSAKEWKELFMKKIITIFLSIILILSLSLTSFCATKRIYYVKYMLPDYSNWIWQEIKNVTSCEKTQDGLQYIIKYKGIPEPRIRTWKLSENEIEYNLTMTIGIDNVLIYEYEE